MGDPHKLSCSRRIREQGTANDWPPGEIARAIHQHCSVSLLRAHRIAFGYTLQQVATKLRFIIDEIAGPKCRLSHQRVSQWELMADLPNFHYLDALCRLYRTRADQLGFGHDYSDTCSDATVHQDHASAAGGRGRVYNVNRRDLLHTVSGLAGGLLSLPTMEVLRNLRRSADTLLTTSVDVADVEHWEQAAVHYGHLQLRCPPPVFLARVTSDFEELHQILDGRLSLEFQKRLLRVFAQLAAMIACEVNVIGPSDETYHWFRTARSAADETGDRVLRAWVVANEAMSHLWYGRSPHRAATLAQTAQAIAGANPSPAKALAAAMEARAQARLGKRPETLAAVKNADSVFGSLREEEKAVNLLGFHEHLLRFCQGNALTRIGDVGLARQMHERAAQIPHAGVLDATLVELDAAICQARYGEPDDALSRTLHAMAALPEEERHGIAAYRTREILTLVPAGASVHLAVEIKDLIRHS